MDQATAEKAPKEMARLVGEWTLEAIGPYDRLDRPRR